MRVRGLAVRDGSGNLRGTQHVPLFRRRRPEPEIPTFVVGVDNHRVTVGGPDSGCSMLAELDNYVGLAASRATPTSDGRDPVVVQNAKMDYVEMVESAVVVVSLALEELGEQGFVSDSEVPSKPQLQRVEKALPTYEYIQTTYGRAQERVEWIRVVDGILRERGIAILDPVRESNPRYK